MDLGAPSTGAEGAKNAGSLFATLIPITVMKEPKR